MCLNAGFFLLEWVTPTCINISYTVSLGVQVILDDWAGRVNCKHRLVILLWEPVNSAIAAVPELAHPPRACGLLPANVAPSRLPQMNGWLFCPCCDSGWVSWCHHPVLRVKVGSRPSAKLRWNDETLQCYKVCAAATLNLKKKFFIIHCTLNSLVFFIYSLEEDARILTIKLLFFFVQFHT